MPDPGDRFKSDRIRPNCGLPYEHDRHPFEPVEGMIDTCNGKDAKVKTS